MGSAKEAHVAAWKGTTILMKLLNIRPSQQTGISRGMEGSWELKDTTIFPLM